MPTEKAPAFQFYVKDWRSSRRVQRMSFAERGMYLEMLCEQWDAGSLPDDQSAVCNILGGTAEEWATYWPVLRENFQVKRGRLVNLRLEKERTKQAMYRRRQSDNAASMWRKKKAGKVDATAMPRHSHGIATAVPPHLTRTGSGNALLSSSSIADCNLQIASSGGRSSKRPEFQNEKFVVFRWQIDALISMLGAHVDSFDLDEWLMTGAYQRACAETAVVPDWWKWLKAETLREAQRRGIPIASDAPTVDPDSAKFAALMAKGPSVRP